jgi:prepilin-type N-terminal cleavage/methylation domain-containing protein/prepilin-type processing-associated H-X9-DG protein
MPSSTRRRRAGFTLTELLVAIGIILLMVSILLPSLAGARRQAKTVQCLANLKQIASAQEMYASQWNGYAVPVFLFPKDTRVRWLNNNQFRTNLGQQPVRRSLPAEEYNKRRNRYSVGLICPEASQALSRVNEFGAPLQLSYSYNAFQATVLPEGAPAAARYFRGFQKTTVRRPSHKLMFIDGLGAQVNPRKSFYDGEEPGYDETKDEDEEAFVHYRHGKARDRANVLFWDGHGETLARSAIEARSDQDRPWHSLWNPTRDE